MKHKKQLFPALMLLAVAFILQPFQLFSQTTFFSKTYGSDSLGEGVRIVKELPGGGFIMLGEVGKPDGYTYQLIKTDASGNEIFIKDILKTPRSYSNWMLNVNNEGGLSFESRNNSGSWEIIKTDSTGNVIENKKISLHLNDFPSISSFKIVKVGEEGYVILVQSNLSWYLYKINMEGEKQWTKNLFPDDTTRIQIHDIISHNNQFLLAGITFNPSGLFLATLNNSGVLIAAKLYANKRQLVRKIIAASDGNYLIGGRTSFEFLRNNTAMADIVFTKFSPNLDTLWSKVFYTENDTNTWSPITDGIIDFEPTRDGGAIILSDNGSMDLLLRKLLIRIDRDGNKLWERKPNVSDTGGFSSLMHSYNDLIVTSDGGYALAGMSSNNNNNDYVLHKTNPYGMMNGIRENRQTLKNSLLSAFPNPSTGNISIVFDETSGFSAKSISLYDIRGKEIRKYSNITENTFILQRDGLLKGMYLLRVSFQTGEVKQAKLILE